MDQRCKRAALLGWLALGLALLAVGCRETPPKTAAPGIEGGIDDVVGTVLPVAGARQPLEGTGARRHGGHESGRGLGLLGEGGQGKGHHHSGGQDEPRVDADHGAFRSSHAPGPGWPA